MEGPTHVSGDGFDLRAKLKVLRKGGRVHLGYRGEPTKEVTGRRLEITQHLPYGSWRIIRDPDPGPEADIWLQLKGPIDDDDE